jgi:S1-C subfamily serine protease
MKTGSHHRVAARVLATVPATALATGLILVLGAPSSSGSGTSGQSSGLVPFPAARPAQVASTEEGIIAQVKPSVVMIDTRLRYDSEAAAGTGMVINPDGLVLTNNHVIEDATSITATVAGKTYQAQVAGYDRADDIALLRLRGAARLPAVPVGNSSLVNAGQTVVALGNTALSVAGQIAAGEASSDITIGYPPFLGTFTGTGSNPNPLGQMRPGQLAAPAPALSCYTSDTGLTPPLAIAPVSSGVLVQGVICASPAARAGMTGGAVITAVSGQPVRSPDDLSRAMARFRSGDTISVTWMNPASERTTSRIRLTAGPPQ